MAKKKQEKKEKEELEVTSKPKREGIEIKFGDVYALLSIGNDEVLSRIFIIRPLSFGNSFSAYGDNIEKTIAVFKKIIAIYDALNVLRGG